MISAQSSLENLLVIGGVILVSLISVVIIVGVVIFSAQQLDKDLANSFCSTKPLNSCNMEKIILNGKNYLCKIDVSANKCVFDRIAEFAVSQSCSDGEKNQNESDVDCGGVCGSTCEIGKSCNGLPDCQSNACINNKCEQCTDADNDFFYLEGGICGPVDCNDVNPNINPSVTETCDFFDNDCDGFIDEGESGCQISGNGFFGMKILAAQKNGDEVTVETTGAKYVLRSNELEMWRKIDPATNSINPKKIALLSFGSDIGPLNVVSADSKSVKIHSTKAEFEFMSDSLFFITAKSPFTYTHTNLLANAPWNKGVGRDRMWTDGYGGSLHAGVHGSPTVVNNTDSTHFNMSIGNTVAHMAFPPKRFDYEKLYGANSRPLVSWVFDSEINYFMENIDNYVNNDFGVVLFFAPYTKAEEPVLLPSGVMGYEFTDPTLINNFVSLAHSKGFKVITYLSWPANLGRWSYPAGHPKAGQFQNISTTLAWMREFQEQYNLDGWYFDNANAGGFLEDYNFIRQVRTDVGNDGIIYHHDSVDVWGSWSGLVAVMVDAYVDYTLKGETGRPSPNLDAQIDEPNDFYLRFYSSGYGMSQAIGDHKLLSSGKTAITPQENNRVLAENLNGIGTHDEEVWLSHTKPFYDARRNQYINDRENFVYDPWPINPQTGWFRAPTNIKIEFITGTTVNISWETNSLSDSEVAYTSNEEWLGEEDLEHNQTQGIIRNPETTFRHGIVVSNLIENTQYEFRIRSNNRQGGLGEIIWGYVGNFTTKNADEDGDGMADDWEMQYFGNLNRDGNGDFDSDNLIDREEFKKGTNPAKTDSDCDEVGDGEEVIGNSDPTDWRNTTVPICGNKICQYGEDSQNCAIDCPNGLVGYWGFDCGNAKDQSPNALDGTLHNTIWSSNGGFDGKGAFDFNPENHSHITLNSEVPLSPNITISAWIKRNSLNRFDFITGGDCPSYTGIHEANNLLIFSYANSTNSQRTCYSNIPIDTSWHHVAFVASNNSNIKIYLDGNDVTSTTSCNHPISSGGFNLTRKLINNNGGIGRFSCGASGFMNGTIDEVRIYNRTLSQQEVCGVAGGHLSGNECIT